MVGLLAGCSTGSTPFSAGSATTPSATTWVLAQAAGVAGRTYVAVDGQRDGHRWNPVLGTRPSLTFVGSDLSVATGCNGSTGAASLVDGHLAVTGRRVTEIGCDGALNDQETWLNQITEDATVLVQGTRLQIRARSDMLSLVEEGPEAPEASLTDTPWRVTTTSDSRVAVPPADGPVELRISLDHPDPGTAGPANEVTGTLILASGCNSPAAPITVEFSSGVPTSMVVGSPSGLVKGGCSIDQLGYEAALFDDLGHDQVAIAMHGDQLTLSGATQTLTFTPPPR